jgi:hypothetical protein
MKEGRKEGFLTDNHDEDCAGRMDMRVKEALHVKAHRGGPQTLRKRAANRIIRLALVDRKHDIDS